MNAVFKFLFGLIAKLFAKHGKLIVTTTLNFLLGKLFSGKKKPDRSITQKKVDTSVNKPVTSDTEKNNGITKVNKLLPNNNRKSKRGRRVQYIGKKRIIHTR